MYNIYVVLSKISVVFLGLLSSSFSITMIEPQTSIAKALVHPNMMSHYKSSCTHVVDGMLWWMNEWDKARFREESVAIKAAKPFLITAAYDLIAGVVLLTGDCKAHCRFVSLHTQDNISFELGFKPSFINDGHNYSIGWCRLPCNLSFHALLFLSLSHKCTSTHIVRINNITLHTHTHWVWHHINIIEHILSIKMRSSHTFSIEATKWWIISD